MNSKTNNKNRKGGSTLSFSSSSSPYNLRRNQSKPGAIEKRSSSTKSKRELRITSSLPTNQNENLLKLKKVQSSTELEENESTIDTEAEAEDQSSETSQGANDTDIENEDQSSPASGSASDTNYYEDEGQPVEDNDGMERSDEEEESVSYLKGVKREETKLLPIRQNFEQLTANIYLCTFCSKCIKASNNNDANLRSHLGRAHKMLEVMYQSQQQQRLSKLHDIKPERKKELDEAVIDSIITDGRVFGDFHRAGMVKFLNVACPGYKAPNRKTIRRRIGISYHQYRVELRTALATIDFIAISVDIWTKHQTYYICLTGHVFNNEYKLISMVLGFRHLVGSHHANNIKKYIMYELNQLQIKEKVCAIVSDNGTDIVKVINDSMPGKRFSCIAHDLNRIVKNGLKLWNTPHKKKMKPTRSTTNSNEYDPENTDDTQSETDSIDIHENHQENDNNDTPTAHTDEEDGNIDTSSDHDNESESYTQSDSDNYSNDAVESEREDDCPIEDEMEVEEAIHTDANKKNKFKKMLVI